MTNLQIIADAVSKYRANKIPNLGPKPKKRKNETQDEKIFRLLFGNIAPDNDEEPTYLGIAKSTSTYRNILSRFYKALLPMLHFIDFSKARFSLADKAEIESSRMQVEVMTLLKLGARRPGMALALRLLAKAQEYSLEIFVIYSSGVLRKIASENGEERDSKKYAEIQLRSIEKLKAEEHAKALLDEIITPYGKSIAQKPELAGKAMKYVRKISEMSQQNESYIMQRCRHKLLAIAYQIDHKYRESIDVWGEFKKYLDTNQKFASDTRYAEIAIQQMDCYMHLGAYDEGHRCAQEAKKYFWTRDSFWFTFMEFYFLLCMQSGKYQEAGNILEEAMQEKLLDTISEISQTKWQLFTGYYLYAIADHDSLKHFNLNEYLSRHLVLTHDKRGYNVSFMILNWCMLLRKGNITKLMDIANAIKEYRLRNLQEDPRTNLFLIMMHTADRYEYDPLKLEGQTAAFIQEIQKEPILYSANMEGLEVIPFEDLLQMTLHDMKKWSDQL